MLFPPRDAGQGSKQPWQACRQNRSLVPERPTEVGIVRVILSDSKWIRYNSVSSTNIVVMVMNVSENKKESVSCKQFSPDVTRTARMIPGKRGH